MPKIYCFDVEPAAVGLLDSVRLHWKVRGEPTIMFDKVKMAVPEADSLQLLEFTLSVKKGTKDPAHRKKQVILLPEASKSLVYVRVDSLSTDGSNFIAIGMNDTAKWKDIYILSIFNPYDRDLTITHGGITKQLKEQSSDNLTWRNTPYGGPWEITSLLSEKEKKDHSIIPTRLGLHIMITPGKINKN